MARLNFIHFADEAFTSAETGKLNIIGVFDQINAPVFPARHGKFCVVINIEASPGKHSLEFDFTHAGKKLMGMKGEAVSQTPHLQFINSVADFTFPEPGIYSVEVRVDGELVGKKSVELKKTGSGELRN